jgi:hemerythrin superfamily protein
MAKSSMDAIALLTADHNEVRSMFREAESAGVQQKHQLFLRMRDALKTHTAIEEEIFYPALEHDMADEIREARSEHKTVDQLLLQLGRIQAEDIRFTEMLRELMQNVEHHASEEEQEIFPRSRELLGEDKVRQLGEQLQQRKRTLLGQQGRAA